MMNKQQTIKQILDTCKNIAVVGFSSKSARAGYYVPAYLHERGYNIIPVNPNLTEALGQTAYPDLASIPTPVDLVLFFRRSEDIPPFIPDAIAIGAKAIWLQLGIINQQAAQQAQDAGLLTVMDACALVEHRKLY
ncbi:MAG TPA: CoA-binding protein [Anaerolineae bacterium]|nr:CoA-binding protein [Anaerolineae bacterium]